MGDKYYVKIGQVVSENELPNQSESSILQSMNEDDPGNGGTSVRIRTVYPSPEHKFQVQSKTGAYNQLVLTTILAVAGLVWPLEAFMLSVASSFSSVLILHGEVTATTLNTRTYIQRWYEVFNNVYLWYEPMVITERRDTHASYSQTITHSLYGNNTASNDYNFIRTEYSDKWEQDVTCMQEAIRRYQIGLGLIIYPYWSGYTVDNTSILP